MKQGALHKRGHKLGVPAWNERWAVLTGDELTLHDAPGKPAKHSLVMSGATISLEKTAKNGATGFRIWRAASANADQADGTVELELAADTADDAVAWIIALKQAGASSSAEVDRAFGLAAAEDTPMITASPASCLAALRSLPLVFGPGNFSGSQRSIRALGRLLDALALGMIVVNVLTLHRLADNLLGGAALIFFIAGFIELATCSKERSHDGGHGAAAPFSLKSCGAGLADLAAAGATTVALGCIHLASGSWLLVAAIAHGVALVVELNLVVWVTFKAQKLLLGAEDSVRLV